jgi:hypothetical protein
MTTKERFCFIAGVVIIFLLLLAFLIFSTTTASAQTCPDPNRRITTNVDPSGFVTISSPNIITQIDFQPDSNARYRPVNWGAPTILPSVIYPNTNSAPFYLSAASPGISVTVRMTVHDVCGAWPTFAGAGAAIFPTAGPMATATALPTQVPTPTKMPTLTPIAPPPLPSFWTENDTFLPGDSVVLRFRSIENANKQDTIVLMKASNLVVMSSHIYTSSCKAGVWGNYAINDGMCLYELPDNLPLDDYRFAFFKSGIGSPYMTTVPVHVTAPGAVNGNPKFFTVRSSDQDWGICGCERGGTTEGYIGAAAELSPPDNLAVTRLSAAISGVGNALHFPAFPVPSGAIFPRGWSEVGILRYCEDYDSPYSCAFQPYASVGDPDARERTAILNGNDGRTLLNTPPPILYQMETYSVGGGGFQQMFCGPVGLGHNCCPIWPNRPLCDPRAFYDLPTMIFANGFRLTFFGQEGTHRFETVGRTRHKFVKYCCNAYPTWDNWPCTRTDWVVDELAEEFITMELRCPTAPPFGNDYSEWMHLSYYREGL